MQWQPIDTLEPKTLAIIYAKLPSGVDFQVISYYVISNGQRVFQFPDIGVAPTYWMPLPPSPEPTIVVRDSNGNTIMNIKGGL